MHENLVKMHQIIISTMPYHNIISSQSLLFRLLPNLILDLWKIHSFLPNYIFTCKFVNHIDAFCNCKDMVIDEILKQDKHIWWYIIYIASRYKHNVLLVSLLNLNCVNNNIKILWFLKYIVYECILVWILL
jgi:hypothetical protein